MAQNRLDRRTFLQGAAAAGAALSLPAGRARGESRPDYAGPNVVIVRFGGGVRRREVLDPEKTYAPYFLHTLVPRGVLFPQMEIGSFNGIETSHGQGTLYLLTGKYHKYEDIEQRFLGARFEAPVPTLFEYLRRQFNVAPHEAVIINGEDRTDEEFYNFSNHHLFGVDYRSTTLSLFRYKQHVLRRQLAEGGLTAEEQAEKTKKLAEMEKLDYRTAGHELTTPEIASEP